MPFNSRRICPISQQPLPMGHSPSDEPGPSRHPLRTWIGSTACSQLLRPPHLPMPPSPFPLPPLFPTRAPAAARPCPPDAPRPHPGDLLLVFFWGAALWSGTRGRSLPSPPSRRHLGQAPPAARHPQSPSWCPNPPARPTPPSRQPFLPPTSPPPTTSLIAVHFHQGTPHPRHVHRHWPGRLHPHPIPRRHHRPHRRRREPRQPI